MSRILKNIALFFRATSRCMTVGQLKRRNERRKLEAERRELEADHRSFLAYIRSCHAEEERAYEKEYLRQAIVYIESMDLDKVKVIGLLHFNCVRDKVQEAALLPSHLAVVPEANYDAHQVFSDVREEVMDGMVEGNGLMETDTMIEEEASMDQVSTNLSDLKEETNNDKIQQPIIEDHQSPSSDMDFLENAAYEWAINNEDTYEVPAMDYLEATAQQWIIKPVEPTEMDCLEDAASEWAMERMADQLLSLLTQPTILAEYHLGADDSELEDEEFDFKVRRNCFGPLASLGSMEISAY